MVFAKHQAWDMQWGLSKHTLLWADVSSHEVVERYQGQGARGWTASSL